MELVSLTVSVVALLVSVWAIFDVRKKVRKLIKLEYHRSYAKVLQDMAWIFVEPTCTGYPANIVKGLEDFSILTHILTPGRQPDTPKQTIEREALVMADGLVRNGSANWLPELDMERVKQALLDWQNQKNKVRLRNVLGELDKLS